MTRASIAALTALLALVAIAVPGEAKMIDCGTLAVARARLPVQVAKGSVTCTIARRAMRRFMPVSGPGVQAFRFARRRWFCAEAHGRALARGTVAHCVSGRVKVVLLRPPPEPGGTRELPIPFGSEGLSGEWRIRVLGTIRDATALVLAENQFNEPPPADRQFYIAKVRVTYTGAGSESFDGSYRLRAVGNEAVEYTTFYDSCGVIPDEITDAEVFTGGTIEGHLCWSIRSADAASLVMYDDGPAFTDASRVFFALTP
jgi:hypothetical protein